MVEAHYRAQVGTDPTLVAWFYVRMYKGGKIWIRTAVENGYVDITTGDKSYAPVVTIGGIVVYNNGGGTLAHYAHTRWTAEGWINGDPQITPKLDTTYLKNSELVPNYITTTADSATLNGLYQTYAPNQNGNWTLDMGNTGYQDMIGILPQWDALYITSGADSRAYKSVLANASALNSYPIVWDDSVTKLTMIPSNRPNWTVQGTTAYAAGSLRWDHAHHGSGGYLAYLITGDYYYLETMENQSAMCYLMTSTSKGLGTSRVFKDQTRGMAWCNRTVGQLVAISPAGSVVANDFAQLLSNNTNYWYQSTWSCI
jgi:hypothetical protein